MKVFEGLKNKTDSLAVVGLGYVGLPLACKFGELVNTIGFDINEEKIALYKKGIDPTEEVGNDALKKSKVHFTTDEHELKKAGFIIVAVPTPINGDKTPDLLPVASATRLVGKNLKKDAIVVFESTVYPGVTEDICKKILEEESKMTAGKDFKIGYSPERINPGDKVHRLENIVKIVSGMDEETLNEAAAVYSLIVEAGVYRAPNIKTAEAAKLTENAQRDINIAFMNELAVVFDLVGIETNEVVKAMRTKWNALNFTPGLVGGHCIGIDPYYFIYHAETLGYSSEIIAAGRRVNDRMGKFVADTLIKQLIRLDKNVRRAKICLMGITFKEDCPDTRNSKAAEVEMRLSEYGIRAEIIDPVVDKEDAKRAFGLDVSNELTIKDADCLVFLVAHKEFKNLTVNDLKAMCNMEAKPLIVDVKSIFSKDALEDAGFAYWSL